MQGSFYTAESVDAASLCVQDLLGDFRCVTALDYDLDAVRPPAGRIDFICAVFIGSYAHHTLHILQDGALDAFQHGRRAVVDFVRVGLSELHITLCELTGNIASHVDHGLHARNSFRDLRDYAVWNEDVARLGSLKCDDAAHRSSGQVF